MNATRETPVCCMRCRSDSETVVLGRDGDSVLVECHACLTLQVTRLRQADQKSERDGKPRLNRKAMIR